MNESMKRDYSLLYEYLASFFIWADLQNLPTLPQSQRGIWEKPLGPKIGPLSSH